MKEQNMENLAKEILELACNTLIVNLRFLDMALSHLEPESCDISLATDGDKLYFNPKHILLLYKERKERTVRDYLHVVLHCVFKHMFVSKVIDTRLWNIACDITVENMINDLDIKSATCNRAALQKKELSKIKQELKAITAEKVYRYLCDENPDETKLERLEELFEADDHSIWYQPGKKSGKGKFGAASDNQKTQAFWQKVASRMEQDLTLFSQGDGSLGLIQNLKQVTREKYDYTTFLKKFSTICEQLKINNDEFDYIYYTYGLQLYEKMPLVEPLEYKESMCIKEFVIALDTSGSVSGELVQTFLQKTYNILKTSESFAHKVNIYIIQCDAAIKEYAVIKSQKDFDRYLENMTFKGFGGTDFRPVFSFVDSLIKEKKFNDLRGLLYFTDGCGTFPEKMPDYKTAFVFIEDAYNNYEVPSWAIKLILQKDDI